MEGVTKIKKNDNGESLRSDVDGAGALAASFAADLDPLFVKDAKRIIARE
jgi:hypothetical protein